ncbi:MAG: hypothetical protein K0V04_39195 [Deltaproteobacteria bacterium]|nr:hypothetical protein [Deltaproteobacteria bacterium]
MFPARLFANNDVTVGLWRADPAGSVAALGALPPEQGLYYRATVRDGRAIFGYQPDHIPYSSAFAVDWLPEQGSTYIDNEGGGMWLGVEKSLVLGPDSQAAFASHNGTPSFGGPTEHDVRFAWTLNGSTWANLVLDPQRIYEEGTAIAVDDTDGRVAIVAVVGYFRVFRTIMP